MNAPGGATLASAARALVVRDLRLLWRRRGDALQPALFAILVVVLFALAMGSERELLSRAAPGVLWVAVWFAVAVAYFALAGRHRLILSPEEEFALQQAGQAPEKAAGASGHARA